MKKWLCRNYLKIARFWVAKNVIHLHLQHYRPAQEASKGCLWAQTSCHPAWCMGRDGIRRGWCRLGTRPTSWTWAGTSRSASVEGCTRCPRSWCSLGGRSWSRWQWWWCCPGKHHFEFTHLIAKHAPQVEPLSKRAVLSAAVSKPYPCLKRSP